MSLRIGDIFEIETPKGRGYLQYAYEHKDLGQLVRVFASSGIEEANDLSRIISANEVFMVHFPLRAAYRKGIVTKIGNCPLPRHFKRPMHMRTENIVRGKHLGWHIVNVDTFVRKPIEKLNSEERRLSPFGVWNDTLLIEKLRTGWSLEDWY